QGAWFPANFDKPHQLNLVANYQLNKRHSVSATFTYSSGRPVSAPVGSYSIFNTIVPDFSDRNQFRIPDYHRLDLSYTIDRNVITRSRFKGSWTFSIYNVYFRRNAYSVFFQKRVGPLPEAFRLAVLGIAFPAITYNFKF
ncbi:MAG: TonB-dependent receptor, partial [Bacteroidota bacterium]